MNRKMTCGFLALIMVLAPGILRAECNCSHSQPGFMAYLLCLPSRASQDIRPVGPPTETTLQMEWGIAGLYLVPTQHCKTPDKPTPCDPTGGIGDPTTGPTGHDNGPPSGPVPCLLRPEIYRLGP